MRDCWAECLGDCDGKQSSEHYVSANVLGDGPIRVRGLPWCREEFKTISTANFVRNMLCKRHNEQLSPVDQGGGNAWRQLQIFANSAKRAVSMPKGARPVSMRVQEIDGPLFERWLLKTITNVAYLDDSEGEPPWEPNKEWVELIFGKRKWPDKCGLYLETNLNLGRPRGPEHFIAARILTYPGTKNPCGGQMKLHDWGLTVSLVPLSPTGVAYHPRFLKLAQKRKTFRVLRFDWK